MLACAAELASPGNLTRMVVCRDDEAEGFGDVVDVINVKHAGCLCRGGVGLGCRGGKGRRNTSGREQDNDTGGEELSPRSCHMLSRVKIPDLILGGVNKSMFTTDRRHHLFYAIVSATRILII